MKAMYGHFADSDSPMKGLNKYTECQWMWKR